MFLFAWLATFSSYLMRSSTSMTFAVMAKEFGWDLTVQGLFLASFLISYGFFNWAAVLVHRFPPKRTLVLSLGLSALAFGAVPLVANLSPYAILGCRILAGCFEGAVYPLVTGIVVRWASPRENALVTSLVFGGPNVANMVGLFLSPYIIEGVGWRVVFYAYALFILLWLAVFAVVGTDSPATLGRARFSPSWLRLNEAELAERPPPRDLSRGGVPWRLILSRRETYALLWTHGLTCNAAFYLILSWLPTYMSEHLGQSLSASGGLSALPFICNIVASAAFGRLSDYLLQRKWSVLLVRKLFQSVSLGVPALCLLVIGLAQTGVPATIALMCVAVSAMGCFASGSVSNFRDLYGPFAASMFALSNGFAQFSGLVAIVTVGPLVEAYGWSAPFVVTCVTSVIGALVFVAFGKADLIVPANDAVQMQSLVDAQQQQTEDEDDEDET